MHAGLTLCLQRGTAPVRPQVMGIVNVTPDSFSDGGQFLDPVAAIEHGHALAEAGADILDVGGESTRPGAQAVSAGQELARVLPVIDGLAATGLPVSIDTSKPEVMHEAVASGAAMINDVNALREPGAPEAAAEAGVPVCLMHMQGTPRTMQQDPVYADVVAEVRDFLLARARVCEEAGLPRSHIVIDPGFGFGKTVEHNLQLLRGLPDLVATGYPVLVGLSRKSMLQSVTGRAVGERLSGSLALTTVASWLGARIVRVHDVAETLDAVKVAHAARAVAMPADGHGEGAV